MKSEWWFEMNKMSYSKKVIFKEINRTYRMTSGELRKALGIEGEVLYINLWKGRTPTDEMTSPDKDIWEIVTMERKKEVGGGLK